VTKLTDDELNDALDALRAAEDADREAGLIPELSDSPDDEDPVERDAKKRARRNAAHRAAPLYYKATDLGNAERLVAQHGDDLRFCPGLGWLAWDGRRWQKDDTGERVRRAKLTVRAIYAEAAAISDEAVRKAVAAWAKKSESAGHIRALLSLAESDERIVVSAKDVDSDPFAFNVTNGTIDLRTGVLRPHRREDLITKLAPVAFNPEASAPIFQGFLSSVFARDAHLIGFVQRFLGYSLTADTREQVLFFAYGHGSNGKSTLFSLVCSILGDYAKTAAPSLLVARPGQQPHPTERADLHGARLVTAVEIGQGKALDEELVKQLTGTDVIKARYMGRDFFEFAPTHKLLISANHKPSIKGTDHAIWRRIALVPFAVRFDGEGKDAELPAKLARELEGVLAWLVQGCLEWLAEGLRPPASVIEATAAYRREQDTVGTWLEDRCVAIGELWVTSASLYTDYQEWAKATGEHPLTQRALGMALTERGFTPDKGSKGVRIWRGVGLKASNTPAWDDHYDPDPSEGVAHVAEEGPSATHSATQLTM